MPAKSPIERPRRVVLYLSAGEQLKLKRIQRRRGDASVASAVRSLILGEYEKLYGPFAPKQEEKK